MAEEIIIDGIDVRKCTHIDNWKHCNCCNDLIKTIYPKATKCHIEEDLRCEIYPNCYFKQLKRKEQALDKLIPILEYYATSTIGRKQVDGTYKYVCSTNKFGDELCLNYDPRLAIEGLNIINKTKEIKR